jgi:hypothetical protein
MSTTTDHKATHPFQVGAMPFHTLAEAKAFAAQAAVKLAGGWPVLLVKVIDRGTGLVVCQFTEDGQEVEA